MSEILQLFPTLSAHSFSSILLTQFSLFKTCNKNNSYSEENFSQRLSCLQLTLFLLLQPPTAPFSLLSEMHTVLVSEDLPSFKHCPAASLSSGPHNPLRSGFKCSAALANAVHIFLTQLDLWAFQPCFPTPLISVFSTSQPLFFCLFLSIYSKWKMFRRRSVSWQIFI